MKQPANDNPELEEGGRLRRRIRKSFESYLDLLPRVVCLVIFATALSETDALGPREWLILLAMGALLLLLLANDIWVSRDQENRKKVGWVSAAAAAAAFILMTGAIKDFARSEADQFNLVASTASLQFAMRSLEPAESAVLFGTKIEGRYGGNGWQADVFLGEDSLVIEADFASRGRCRSALRTAKLSGAGLERVTLGDEVFLGWPTQEAIDQSCAQKVTIEYARGA